MIEEAVRWWCKREKKEYPNNEGLHTEYKRKAVLGLIRDYNDKAGFSVLGVAFRTGSAEIVKKLLHMKNVMCFDKNETCDFDITTLTPLTNGSNARRCGSNKIRPQISCLEGLLHMGSTDTLARILDIPPVRQIEQAYSALVLWTYTTIFMLHFMYMIVFSFSSFYLSERRRTSPSDPPFDLLTFALYFILPIEPLLIIYHIISKVNITSFLNPQHKSVLIENVGRITIGTVVSFLFSSSYAFVVLYWIGLYVLKQPASFFFPNQEYVLTPALVLGWLLTITFTRGIKGLHCFWRTFRDMIFHDVLKFSYIYINVLLAFSIGVHNLFQVEPDIAKHYPSLLDTISKDVLTIGVPVKSLVVMTTHVIYPFYISFCMQVD
ncbi:transient receptor potential cation channel subfamily V member 3-like [Gigantopelta aegis]|uniref:transient receptor potential cation channel subfamily V member 3-like n=1 Tax=Gigantopelta aegis TaxID=1735272 RepID=UPI001B88E5CA|nr:transient receptor potential cation channel subfamily V member 3-like [Gigantopelta aegis]